MSARDNMFDPDGSTKASIDGIKDAKQKEVRPIPAVRRRHCH